MIPLCSSKFSSWGAAILAAIGWSALATEFYFLLGEHHPPRIAHALVQFFSFFTVISNLLVAMILTAWAVRPVIHRVAMWRARVTAATVVYILMTGLVYTLFLRQSHGNILGLAVDVALHYLMPVSYVLFWLLIMPKRRLGIRDACSWLVLPLVFAMASIVRGAITAEYTYFFLNPTNLGYMRVVFIIVCLSLPFLGLGIVVVKVNEMLAGTVEALDATGGRQP